MHVLHVMASGAPGGGADHLLALLPALQAQGVSVSAQVGDDGDLSAQLMALGIPAWSTPMMGRRLNLRLGRSLTAQAARVGATALHLHGSRAGVLAAMGAIGRSAPLPRIYSAHGLAHRAALGLPRRGLRLLAEAWACWRTRAVISVSAADLQLLQALGAVPRGEAYHLPNVVRCAPPPHTNACPPALRARRRRGLGLPPAAPVVLTVSRLVRQKNVTAAADAILRLPGVHLAVVGAGPERGVLLRHPLAQAGRLHLLGARDDVPAVLPLCDAFVLSSRWEGEPIALLEAIAWGLPWVATRTAGALEIAAACRSGCVVPQEDTAGLAQALARQLAGGPEVDAEVALGVAAVALRRPPQLAARMAHIYARVLL